jgi:hypothetical protein
MPSTPGPHHCIGMARTTAELIFRDLRARCVAAGGNLSLDQLENARTRFFGSFASGFDLFEAIHADCMDASGSTAAPKFSRDNILAALLLVSGDTAARHAFSIQVAHFNQPWLEQFFEGFAQFIRRTVIPSADHSLIAAYVEAAGRMKSRLSVDEFLKEDAVRLVLRECAEFLVAHGGADAMAGKASIAVNDLIAAQNRIAGPDLRKVTDNQMKQFLSLLLFQLRTAPFPMLPTREEVA